MFELLPVVTFTLVFAFYFLIIFVFNSVSNETKTVMKWLTVHCVKKYIKL